MRLVATGDSVLTRRLSPLNDPQLDRVRSVLTGADLAVTNLESALPSVPAMPAAIPQGVHLAGSSSAVAELQWLGVGLCNYANNHVLDYCPSGLDAALGLLDAAGMPFAGAGRNLAQAREPVFVDTAAGRVAMIGVCSSTADRSLASDPGLNVCGRPGINPLRFRTLYQVTEQQLRFLEGIDEELGTAAARRNRVAASLSRATGGGSGPVGGRAGLRFADHDFVVGAEPKVISEPHAADLAATQRAVDFARASADVVLVSVHCHESAHDGWNTAEVPDFLVAACHAWVEAGADAVVGHGPHCVRAIEIYDGRPILYSLGNFIQSMETVPFLPPEAYERQGLDPSTATVRDYYAAYEGFGAHDRFWTALVAVLDISPELARVELLPISLGQARPAYRRGLPEFADESVGRRVLGEVGRLSEPFGTQIDIVQRAESLTGAVRENAMRTEVGEP